VKCGKNIKHFTTNLEVRRRELAKKKLNETLEVAQERFASQACKRRRIEEIDGDKGWMAEQRDPKRQRQRTLVLEGRSGTGKTEFAKSLYGFRNTLEVNCASGGEVNLKELDLEKHKAVLLDEATPEMVLQQRKLFQCPAAWISLGNSTTNCHAYDVCLYRIPIIICSNNWSYKLNKLTPVDAAWIQENTCHVSVQEKLWLQQSTPSSGHYQ